MNPPDASTAALDAFPEIPRDADGPVFAEPWQAQAFAMAVSLNQAGHFTWSEWAEHLGAEIKAAGTGDSPDNYFQHWLTALEKITQAQGLIGEQERLEHQQAWDRAARATPHGEPIRLGRDRD